jgi:hypothetical protein
MVRTPNRLPKRFPVGSKYVVESCGPVVRRYVECPDGRKFTLLKRKALPCTQAGDQLRFEQRSRRPREKHEGGKRPLNLRFAPRREPIMKS